MSFRGWVWQIDEATLEPLIDAALADPPRIGFANDMAIMPVQNRLCDRLAAADFASVSFGALPPIELVVAEPGFAPDHFAFGGLQFVSAALRAALALPPTLVEYLPVDASRSRPEVIARDYRVMHPLLVRPLIDLRRTSHEVGLVKRADGSIGERVILDPESRQYWREDFVADVPIFLAAHWHATIVDDALAERILTAGVSGVAFQDLICDEAQHKSVYKSITTPAD